LKISYCYEVSYPFCVNILWPGFKISHPGTKQRTGVWNFLHGLKICCKEPTSDQGDQIGRFFLKITEIA
jgi:hypothetical protein